MQKMFTSMALVLSVADAKVSTAVTKAWRVLIGGQIGIYWPEAHYMRDARAWAEVAREEHTA
jgi:hypothetical protein